MRASPRSRRCRRREKFADLDIYWWEEPTSRDRQETVHEVAHRSPIPVATGEMYDTVGQFYTLAAGGGVNIFQPEPMSLGGIAPTHAGRQSGAGPWQLHRAAPERRAGRDGGLPAACRRGAELPDPGAFRRLQRAVDARARDLASDGRSERTAICRCPTRRASASTSTSRRSRRIPTIRMPISTSTPRAGKSGWAPTRENKAKTDEALRRSRGRRSRSRGW